MGWIVQRKTQYLAINPCFKLRTDGTNPRGFDDLLGSKRVAHLTLELCALEPAHP